MVNAVGAVTLGNVVVSRKGATRSAVCRAPSASLRLRNSAAVVPASSGARSMKTAAAPALGASFAASASLNDAVAASLVRKSHAARTVVKCNASAAAADEG